MKDFWNQRYSETKFTYGELPNEFFKEQLEGMRPGRIFLPAEGQGRNAAFAASQGWKVLAADYSEAGQRRALELAARQQVEIDFRVADLTDAEQLVQLLDEGPFDAAGVIYMHLPPEAFQRVLTEICEALAPGGRLIIEVFSKEQVGYPSGGPKDPDMLHSVQEMEGLLSGKLANVRVWQEVIQLSEGEYHKGPGIVIRAVGVK